MKTRALRLYGKNDLRVEEFELPALVVADSLCTSSCKALIQGGEHNNGLWNKSFFSKRKEARYKL